MTKRVYLHVGLPKSGTTYLQAALGQNKQRLAAEADLLYPGRTWADQVAAVRDLREMHVPASQRARVKGSWARMVGEITDWDGDAIFSMEWLCAATPQQIRRIEGDLAPIRVEVVFTLRDLGRTLPAAWQEFIQNREEWPWDEFLEGVASADTTTSRAARAFWAQQDAPRILGTWSRCLSPAQVHVVTAPPSGAEPRVLWERFCRVLNLDHGDYALPESGSNDSLGLESAEMMRRLNAVTRAYGVNLPAYNRVFKRGMAKDVLSKRKGREPKLVLPPEHHDWVLARAGEDIAALTSLGVNIVGSAEDLVPQLTTGERGALSSPDELEAEAVLDAALNGCVAVAVRSERELLRVRGEVSELDSMRSEIADLRRERQALQGHVDWARTHPVRAALSVLSTQNRVLGWCRRLYVRARALFRS